MERLRILIVDDAKHIRFILKDVLTNLRLVCDDAENGEQALHLCFTHQYDFIVTDWHMPEMDGCYFIKLIRDLSGYQTTPIVILTGDIKAQDKNQHLGTYPELDWLSKDNEPSDLIKYLCRRIFNDDWLGSYHAAILHLS